MVSNDTANDAVTPDEREKIQYKSDNLTGTHLSLTIRVVCSKGTYIRALARDIGQALNSGGYLTDLVRTRIGEYKLQDCLDIEHFNEWLDNQTIEKVDFLRNGATSYVIEDDVVFIGREAKETMDTNLAIAAKSILHKNRFEIRKEILCQNQNLQEGRNQDILFSMV